MLKFSVPDMSCGHCVGAITKAVKEIDATAKVDADLDRQTVSIETLAGADQIPKALDDAGYPATIQ